MSMSLRQFFERLPKDGWSVASTGEIRRYDDCAFQCPVSSLKNAPISNYQSVGEFVGMPPALVHAIADAADDFAVTPGVKRIRRLLLKHCGLTEPTP